MSNISSYTGRFRAHNNGLHDSPSPRVIKRNRESFVCNPCRRSKLRCDRGHPCRSCQNSNGGTLCKYQPHTTSTNGINVNAEERLSRLEVLVRQIIGTQNAISSSDGSCIAVNDATSQPAGLRAGSIPHIASERNGEASYVGSTHWSAVLDDIHELKAVLSNSEWTQTDEHSHPIHAAVESEVIFGSRNNYPISAIISHSLPPKIEVDRLLSKYLQGGTFIVPFIHSYHFQKQYQEFWKDISKVNPLWLSMLFSICFLASRIQGVVDWNHWTIDPNSQGARFHRAAGECLVAGQYSRPQQYVTEALTIYAHCKNLRTLDPSREAGQVFSMAVRMAYEMGYHRDPDASGSFTVFEGEMRRRLWAVLKQMDLMKSFQLDLPSNIRLENCDTRPPSNLQDADFDETTKVLPPSRPQNEATRLLWFIIKDAQMVGFNKVCRDALSFREKSEAEISELDREIRNLYAVIPGVLRVRPLPESIADAPFVIVTRLFVEFIYLKSLCVLHRRYMAQGNISSTKTCIEAGEKLVGHFLEVYKEFSPGGLLHSERWMLTNYTLNDFLMGVMVLCLAAHIRNCGSGAWWSAIGLDPEGKVTTLLQDAHSVCAECSQVSRDAGRVGQAVSLVLKKSISSEPFSSPAFLPQASSPRFQNIENDLERSNLNIALMSAQDNDTLEADKSFEFLDPFSFMGNDFDNIDWALFQT